MLLIDTDYIAYKAAQASEEGIDFGDDAIISR
ncbi:T7 exonuclease, partial [Thermus thermophilus]|nr:T7 exonuclease [Thermus thermophilus]